MGLLSSLLEEIVKQRNREIGDDNCFNRRRLSGQNRKIGDNNCFNRRRLSERNRRFVETTKSTAVAGIDNCCLNQRSRLLDDIADESDCSTIGDECVTRESTTVAGIDDQWWNQRSQLLDDVADESDRSMIGDECVGCSNYRRLVDVLLDDLVNDLGCPAQKLSWPTSIGNHPYMNDNFSPVIASVSLYKREGVQHKGEP